MNYEIQTLSQNGTEYTFAGFRLDPVTTDSDLQVEGYRSPFTLFVVFNDGQVYAHHDRYEIARQLSGDREFVLNSVEAIESKLIE